MPRLKKTTQIPKIDRLVVHFGMEKTGSKALQGIIRKNVGPDLAYPISQGLWHRSIHDALLHMDDGPLLSSLEEIAGAPLAVISYEGFHLLPDEALTLLSERVRNAANETWAMLYLRRQDDYAESFINQRWKAHRVPWVVANETTKEILEGKISLDYETILTRIGAGFDRVVPLLYDKSISTHLSFSKAVGVELSTPPRKSQTDVNLALSAVELATLREVKRLAGEHERLVEIVEATRRALKSKSLDRLISSLRDGPAISLSEAQRNTIMKHYADSNERVRKRWFPYRKELFTKNNTRPGVKNAEPRLRVVHRIQKQFSLDG